MGKGLRQRTAIGLHRREEIAAGLGSGLFEGLKPRRFRRVHPVQLCAQERDNQERRSAVPVWNGLEQPPSQPLRWCNRARHRYQDDIRGTEVFNCEGPAIDLVELIEAPGMSRTSILPSARRSKDTSIRSPRR